MPGAEFQEAGGAGGIVPLSPARRGPSIRGRLDAQVFRVVGVGAMRGELGRPPRSSAGPRPAILRPREQTVTVLGRGRGHHAPRRRRLRIGETDPERAGGGLGRRKPGCGSVWAPVAAGSSRGTFLQVPTGRWGGPASARAGARSRTGFCHSRSVFIIVGLVRRLAQNAWVGRAPGPFWFRSWPVVLPQLFRAPVLELRTSGRPPAREGEWGVSLPGWRVCVEQTFQSGDACGQIPPCMHRWEGGV